MSTRIVSLTPTTAELTRWHQVLSACAAVDTPDQPAPSLSEVADRLTAPRPDTARLFWMAGTAEPVGVASLRRSTDSTVDSPDTLELHVHPAHRRQGIGSELLATALAAAREHGCRSLIADTEATPGHAFAAARGFRVGLGLTWVRLALRDLDPAALTALVECPHPGYWLQAWSGAAPESLIDSLVSAKRAMADMPLGELDWGSFHWDAAQVRALATAAEQRGEHLHTVAAVSEADGSIAGFTELAVPQAGPALQHDTVVVPVHRGHGLGLLVKAAMLRRAIDQHPDLAEIRSNTADENGHMRAINTRLGFTTTGRTVLHQLKLDG